MNPSGAVGRVHSVQSLGAVDGPGLRAVLFLQGCPLRCVYCHNPDTWDTAGGMELTAQAAAERLLRFRPYFQKTGGVTVSGGEPLRQWAFVEDVFTRLQTEGVHTALDTSGIGDPDGAARVLAHTDLVLCDIKFATEEAYRRYTGGSLRAVLDFLALAERMNVPLWVRHVVVPGLTDGKENLSVVAALARRFTNLQRLELLPFQTICQGKYDAMGIPFPLAGTPPCGDETVRAARRLLGLPEEG